MALKAVLLQTPVTDFQLRIQIMKKANGWKPFLYDVTYTRVRLTNIVCTNLDPSFSIIEHCKLVAVSRDVNYMTGKVILLQIPITDFQLRIQIMKKANGWKPFLYDMTVGCNFTKKLNPITKLIWHAVQNVTNIKHDCPYNQNLEADHLSNLFVAKALLGLPVPPGEYAFFTTWKAYNVTRATANFYGVFY
ncbi:uncharacterized protein LOC135961455 [Calliphora vicina]|uniref:uncharacterized protein LOC135961455 n=1 Tax=Calliphora vicina TaxID=7373 RepID=UPI00325BE53F